MKPRKLVPLTLTLTLLGSLANASELKKDSLLVFSGQALDLVSTELVLAKGYQEGNPLMVERGNRLAVKLAITLGTTYACKKLREGGRPKAARALAISVGALGGAAALWNFTRKEP